MYGLSCLTVPRSTPLIPLQREGVVLLDDWDGMGQRLTASGRSGFVNVQILPEEIISDSSLHANSILAQENAALSRRAPHSIQSCHWVIVREIAP